MANNILIISDPLCGWCYAAAPLIKLARSRYQVQLYQGGLLTRSRRVYMSAEMRAYVLEHDMRIQALTGQQFAPAYVDGILNDHSFFMDSTIPISAVNASIALGRDGVEMLDAIQISYYIDGQSTSEFSNMSACAVRIGHDAGEFAVEYERALADVDTHIAKARELLHSVGSSSFPTFALEVAGGYQRVDHAAYYDKPAAWLDYLHSVASELGN